jgi:hypothetical protein
MGAINCGSIGAAVYDVKAPLLTYPLLHETADTVGTEKSVIEIDWEDMLADKRRQIKALEAEVARLKS